MHSAAEPFLLLSCGNSLDSLRPTHKQKTYISIYVVLDSLRQTYLYNPMVRVPRVDLKTKSIFA